MRAISHRRLSPLSTRQTTSRSVETYVDIVEAACDAWRRLVAVPEVITSIGMRDWAHIGQR